MKNSSLHVFFGEIFHKPFVTGAIYPSSKDLARLIVEEGGIERAEQIIELGAGLGVITEEILKRKKRSAAFLSFEVNSNFSRVLKTRFPDVQVISDCASRLIPITNSHGIYEASSIISALPWTLFQKQKQEKMLKTIRTFLAKHGRFVTIACLGWQLLPSGKQFRLLLQDIFGNVRTSRVVWRNFPPAFIYSCTKASNE